MGSEIGSRGHRPSWRPVVVRKWGWLETRVVLVDTQPHIRPLGLALSGCHDLDCSVELLTGVIRFLLLILLLLLHLSIIKTKTCLRRSGSLSRGITVSSRRDGWFQTGSTGVSVVLCPEFATIQLYVCAVLVRVLVPLVLLEVAEEGKLLAA